MTRVRRYFLDTEFIEDGSTIDLISIGVRRDDGAEFYRCNLDAKLEQASEWVAAHVLPHLPLRPAPTVPLSRLRVDNEQPWAPHSHIARDLQRFVLQDVAKPEFWAYYADYDWVVVCQLFGKMIDLPKYFPRYCMDLKQLAVMRGNPVLPQQEADQHHALADARWNARVFDFLGGAAWEKQQP